MSEPRRSYGDYVSNLGDVYEEDGKQRRGARNEYLCDFCCLPLAPDDDVWSYPAGEVVIDPTGVSAITHSDDPWAACIACAHLIERGMFDELVDRCIKTQFEQHGLALTPAQKGKAKLHMQSILMRFWEAREGEPTLEKAGKP